MDKNKEHAKTRKGLPISLSLVAVSGFFLILGSDHALKPGLWRNLRMTMEILLGERYQYLISGYTPVRILNWIILAASVVLVIWHLAADVGGVSLFPQKLRDLLDVDRDEDEPEEEVQKEAQEEEKARQMAGPRTIDYQKAEEGLSRLRAMYEEGENVFQNREPCVRVQQLGGDPRKQIDQILEWFGSRDARYAAVTVSSQNQYEILLTHKDGVPCVIGVEEVDDGDESRWVEKEYPMDSHGESTKVMRQSGDEEVNYYVLTWLRGSKL